jgi:hypothetical protein
MQQYQDTTRTHTVVEDGCEHVRYVDAYVRYADTCTPAARWVLRSTRTHI